MDAAYNTEAVDGIISRVLFVEDITLGTAQSPYLARYRGRLRQDPEQAYDQLAAWLKPYNLTPLFRWDDGRHAILLVPGIPRPPATNPTVNLVMAVLTFFSVLVTGALSVLGELPSDPLEAAGAILSTGWPFAVAMLAILGAHEFGHYLAGRYHRVDVTLPYFIPMPLISPFGTMGAFINMRSLPKNRKHLLDIGLAGPLAGLAVAVPVLLLGLALSDVTRLTVQPGQAIQLEGNSIIYLFAKFLMFGQLLPAPATYNGVAPALYWLRYFFTSTPLPLGGLDVSLHPVAWAAWGGLLVTALNLIPAGQLDGGHALYVLLGRERARKVLPFILVALVAMGIVWTGWWLWVAIILLIGRTYAEPLDQITPLDGRRKALAVLALVIFVLIFTPVPLTILGG